MKKLLFIMLMLGGLVACGGDDSSANADDATLTKQQIEEKFNLPPEPDPKVNNATIEGIDSNGIRGRDDVERAIAFEFYKEEVKVKNLFSLSQVHLQAVQAIAKNDIDALKEIGAKYSLYNMCYIFAHAEKGAIDLKKVESFLYNSDERVRLSNSIDYDEGTEKSLNEIVLLCKKRGFTNMPI